MALEEATNLSARLGDLGSERRRQRGSMVGRLCSSRPLNIRAFGRAMQRAWGLHHTESSEAQFRPIGDNMFVVRFGGGGD